MYKIFVFILAFHLNSSLKAQNCSVEMESLKGSYDGDCKKGKAYGNGIAKGDDSYTGEFKNGYPDGIGKYTWKNGDWYEGSWKKGVMEGQGTIYYTGVKTSDSIVTGFWKKGRYVGLYEKPYVIHSQTPNFSSVHFDNTSGLNQININCQSVTGGSLGIAGQAPKPVITNLDLVTGQFQSQTNYDNMPKTSLTTFRGVVFPLRARISYGSDMIDIEIFQPGNWTIDLKLLR